MGHDPSAPSIVLTTVAMDGGLGRGCCGGIVNSQMELSSLVLLGLRQRLIRSISGWVIAWLSDPVGHLSSRDFFLFSCRILSSFTTFRSENRHFYATLVLHFSALNSNTFLRLSARSLVLGSTPRRRFLSSFGLSSVLKGWSVVFRRKWPTEATRWRLATPSAP